MRGAASLSQIIQATEAPDQQGGLPEGANPPGLAETVGELALCRAALDWFSLSHLAGVCPGGFQGSTAPSAPLGPPRSHLGDPRRAEKTCCSPDALLAPASHLIPFWRHLQIGSSPAAPLHIPLRAAGPGRSLARSAWQRQRRWEARPQLAELGAVRAALAAFRLSQEGQLRSQAWPAPTSATGWLCDAGQCVSPP